MQFSNNSFEKCCLLWLFLFVFSFFFTERKANTRSEFIYFFVNFFLKSLIELRISVRKEKERVLSFNIYLAVQRWRDDDDADRSEEKKLNVCRYFTSSFTLRVFHSLFSCLFFIYLAVLDLSPVYLSLNAILCSFFSTMIYAIIRHFICLIQGKYNLRARNFRALEKMSDSLK